MRRIFHVKDCQNFWEQLVQKHVIALLRYWPCCCLSPCTTRRALTPANPLQSPLTLPKHWIVASTAAVSKSTWVSIQVSNAPNSNWNDLLRQDWISCKSTFITLAAAFITYPHWRFLTNWVFRTLVDPPRTHLELYLRILPRLQMSVSTYLRLASPPPPKYKGK